MTRPVITLGDPASHPGTVATACSRHYASNGQLIARQGDTLACALHGPNPISGNVSTVLDIEGAMAALEGSVAACGAVLIPTATSPEAN